MSDVLAIIPARGGSKGIPCKNLQLLSGKPLLAHSIEQARRTPSVDRVVVSTDDPEIARVAGRFGAEIVRRPAELSGDEATSESALLHTLDYLRDTEGYEPDLVVFLQATSPLRRPDDVQKAVETLQKERADSLFSATSVEGFVWRIAAENLSSVTYDYRNRQRRQDIVSEDLMENGSIYVFKPWVLRQHDNRLGGEVAVHLMHPLDSFQVDEPADLATMEQLAVVRGAKSDVPDFSQIQLLVLDFDGVMTDNRVLVDQDGREAVWCHRGDGWGIARLKEAGIDIVVLSTETNPVVAARSRKLGIECIQGSGDKLASLQAFVSQRSLEPQQVAYLGNDVNDIACLKWVGSPIAVADAVPEVLEVAAWTTRRRGGHGAVREVCDWILESKANSKDE